MNRKRKNQTQSVGVMLSNFHNDFESGLTIQQIAEKYDIDKSYIYKLLDKIAENNGVSREYYIKHPQKPHNMPVYDRNNSYSHYKEEDFKSICESFDKVIGCIAELRKEVEKLNIHITNNDCEEMGK